MIEAERKEIALKAREARQDGDFDEAMRLWEHLRDQETDPKFKANAAYQAQKMRQYRWERDGR